ncbi:argininosuccinate synthase [Pseudomonas resinovorans]|uniref:argininosuccinate synthase n=1 Tax=Metapseudomonas resinovorans TaxID=53412 RepID=UPI00237F4E36|nr:argininosuccinate synthase [Pseudomonas resinovorans]MDE3739533.1 argininosuccinate synthase [Pseudomonas resinovorans]
MKIVLAYSGGLDTSVALRWLRERYQAEVIAFCADLGQPEDFQAIREKALASGASKVFIEDLREEYLRDFVFPALRAGALYERRYTMAAPLGRPLIARQLVRIAHAEGAEAVAHGSTGKGNDQVRFYAGVVAHDPALQVLAPCAEWELKSRDEELAYARRHGIPVSATPDSPFSMDGSLWGTSTECGSIDDFRTRIPANAYQLTADPECAPDLPARLTIGFEQGTPVHLDGQRLDAVELVRRLTELGGRHGVGRVDMVENSLMGIKNRALYESPAGAILHVALRELEDLTIDCDTLHCKAELALKYAELAYRGQWWSPLRQALDAFVDASQANVTGTIALRLYKGSITVEGRETDHALLDYSLTAQDSADRFDHPAGIGFAYVWSLPQRIRAKLRGPASEL